MRGLCGAIQQHESQQTSQHHPRARTTHAKVVISLKKNFFSEFLWATSLNF
jgi:hypothetical protein